MDQHRLDEARAHYEAELELLQALGERRSQAATHHSLGVVAEEQRRFAEAEASYRQALDIKLEFGDRRSVGRYLSSARHSGTGAAAVRQG